MYIPLLGPIEFLSGIHCCPKDRCRWCHREGSKAHRADSTRDVFEVPAGSQQRDRLLGVRHYKPSLPDGGVNCLLLKSHLFKRTLKRERFFKSLYDMVAPASGPEAR
jgi:hypothetical protein